MNVTYEDNIKLDDDSIKPLFSLTIDPKTNYKVSLNLQIVYLKKGENNQKLTTATLRDKKSKYNWFIFITDRNSPELRELSLINITSLTSTILQNQKSRVFLIKNYSIITPYYPMSSNVTLIKDDDNNIINMERKILHYSIEDPPTPNSDKRSNNNNNNNININSNSQFASDKYTSLKQLTTFSRGFCILVRVIKKSQVKNYTPNSLGKTSGKLFYFIVLDKEGSEMQITCFNKSVDKFYNLIEENEVYEIKDGYVKISDKKFTIVKSYYKIILNDDSSIIHKIDNGIIKKNNLHLIQIKEISNVDINSFVDVCAIVLEAKDKIYKQTRSGEQFMKTIIIGDISQYKIELTLWRKHANTSLVKGDIVLLKLVKVINFNGIQLSSYGETSISVNPKNIIELEDQMRLMRSYKGEYLDLEKYQDKAFNIKDTFHSEGRNEIKFIRDVINSIDEVEDYQNIPKIKVTVTQIIHNEKNFYLGCHDQKCKKKLIKEGEIYKCNKCFKLYNIPEYYYSLNVRVKDCSCEYWIDIFGKEAESLIKMTAEEYKCILYEGNREKLRDISNGIEFKEFFFWVKPKMQIYSNNSKIKLYVSRIEHIEVKDEAKKLAAQLKRELALI